MQWRDIRVFFSKCDRAKFISHLDLTRCFTRCIKRTDIPAWYTMGYSPRLYMTFPLPLPLGFEGMNESFDMRLCDDAYDMNLVMQRLNDVLPEKIRIIKVDLPQNEPEKIVKAEYFIKIYADNIKNIREKFLELARCSSIIVNKKTKAGIVEQDIAEDVELLSENLNEIDFEARLMFSAGIVKNVNPTLFMEKLCSDGAICEYKICRNTLYMSNGDVWR